MGVRTNLFGSQEVMRVRHEHLFNAGIEDDGRHRPLMTRVCPSPASVGVCEIDLDAVDGLSFILLLGLQNKLLEDRVISCDDAVSKWQPGRR